MTGQDPATVFLRPGELFFSQEPTVISTLLGSCVSITMFSQRLKVGAICHALLPTWRKEEPCKASQPESGKYVECCVKIMLEGLEERGVPRREIEAKCFGGANMFELVGGSRASVGKQNSEKALLLLEGAGVRVVSSDLGGDFGRKIFFHAHTGEVFLKYLARVGDPR